MTISTTKARIHIIPEKWCISYIKDLNCGYVCVCMFAYSSRTDKPPCTKLRMLIPWDKEEILERSIFQKNFLSSSPGKGGSCSSETKHDRITAARPKLFVSREYYRNEGYNPEKLSWARVPVKVVSVTRELITIEEQRKEQVCLFLRRDYRN
jgi:hypothetical protein